MCGLAGASLKSNSSIPTAAFEHALQVLAHRGPDSSGFQHIRNQESGDVVLLHTRLSIIDLDSRSNQPFKDDDCSLIFNGEIYNFRSLRAELQQDGHRFRTEGDTEVLFVGLKAQGRNFLSKIDGMFSIAFHDKRENRILLARDYFGEKPLYYLLNSGELFWGSEPNAVWALSGIKPTPNIVKLQEFIVSGYKSVFKDGKTFFENLVELKRNSWVAFDLGSRELASGEIEPELRPSSGFESHSGGMLSVGELHETLISTLGRRLFANAPAGIALSAGVDSMLIWQLARELGYEDLKTFHIDSGDSRYSERADLELERRSVRNHVVVKARKSGVLKQIQAMVSNRGAPVLTPSSLVHNQLMEAVASEGIKVILGGVGADELFTGYYDHHLLAIAGVSANSPELLESEILAWREKVVPNVRNPSLQDPLRYINNHAVRDHIYFRQEEFQEKLGLNIRSVFSEQTHDSSLLRGRMMNELYYETVPVMLAEEDRNAMQFSIENRSPFLSKELLALSFRYSDQELIGQGMTKRPLRQLLHRYSPRVASNPRKVGFNAPPSSQLAQDRDEVIDYLMVYSSQLGVKMTQGLALELTEAEKPNSEGKLLLSLLGSCIFLAECENQG